MVEEPSSSSKYGIRVKLFSLNNRKLSIGMNIWANENAVNVVFGQSVRLTGQRPSMESNGKLPTR